MHGEMESCYKGRDEIDTSSFAPAVIFTNESLDLRDIMNKKCQAKYGERKQ